MKGKVVLIMPFLLAVTGCGLIQAATPPKPHGPNMQKVFLNYVPPNEPVAPHDMEWIVDHAFGDGGYYHSGHLIGTIDISHDPSYTKKHGPNISFPTPHLDFFTDAYKVVWLVDGTNLDFEILMPTKEVIPTNAAATSVMDSAYAQ
ncbi:MAG: hypothetical protein K6T83_03215 [Alicyclobacillus sp.]|nr:hypothetical protein [Alicyclobacillus sp.]